MSKANDNPFDNFPTDGTPLYFYDRMKLALDWATPHLQDGKIEHVTFVAYCRAYARLLHPEVPLLHGDTLSPAPATSVGQIIVKQRQVVSTFMQIRASILEVIALEKSARLVKAQSERAAKPRKLDEAACKRIAKRYAEAKANGTGYGIVKELASEYEVSVRTIHDTVKRYTEVN